MDIAENQKLLTKSRFAVIGSGVKKDPYRPDLPKGTENWSAEIISNEDGSPKFLDCEVLK